MRKRGEKMIMGFAAALLAVGILIFWSRSSIISAICFVSLCVVIGFMLPPTDLDTPGTGGASDSS